MDTLLLDATKFITLTPEAIAFLFIVGFIGGLVSGFIGSGGAFVLTPGMMSLGVTGTVAVASNMCHKFPKALVGAIKRFKYGQVDIKLGLIMAASAGVGVQVGIWIQKMILAKWGQAGSNLYVSLSFVAVLVIVGGYVLYDALTGLTPGGLGLVELVSVAVGAAVAVEPTHGIAAGLVARGVSLAVLAVITPVALGGLAAVKRYG